MNPINKIRAHFNTANIVEKFIYVNVGVFLGVFLLNTFGFLFQLHNPFVNWVVLPGTFEGFLSKPWAIITYGFVHVSFLHILMNLIALYYIGNLFINFFTPNQFSTFYVLGTVFGGIIFLASYAFFPAFVNDAHNSVLLGASAGVSAIFIGLATYMPNYQLKFPLIRAIKLWHLAVFWVVLDIIQIPAGNAGGHLAHVGGALFGFLYVKQASSYELQLWPKFTHFFTSKKGPLKTVYKSKKTTKKTTQNRAENTTYAQQKTNVILDKISKSGYNTLSKEEKDFLFKQKK